MKEIHAYRNADGTYKLELVGECYDKGELVEVHVVYERVKIKSKDFVMKSRGELFSITVDDGDDYVIL
jgi:hypothetical protein